MKIDGLVKDILEETILKCHMPILAKWKKLIK